MIITSRYDDTIKYDTDAKTINGSPIKTRWCGANLAEIALGRMMDIVEEESGEFPSWDDEAPEWIVKEMIG